MPGCACSYPECSPENCGHVSLFDGVYSGLVDINGTPMHGRFAYDKDSKIILQVILVSVGTSSVFYFSIAIWKKLHQTTILSS